MIDGKETLSPSLKWFEVIVNASLLGYLNSIEIRDESIEENHLEKFAFDDSIVNMIAKKDIVAEQFISYDNLQP